MTPRPSAGWSNWRVRVWSEARRGRLRLADGVFQPGLIVSSRNERVREYRKLSKKTFRYETSRFIAEGPQVLREALGASAAIDVIFFTPDAEGHLSIYADIIAGRHIKTMRVAPEVFERLSSTMNPQGLLAVVEMLHVEPEAIALKPPEPQLLLSQIRDPGNLGAIIRAADAAGAGAVVMSEDCSDLYNTKTVRATAGSLFHLPLAPRADLAQHAQELKSRGFKVIATELGAERSMWDVDMRGPIAIMLGNEARGLSAEHAALADESVRIPIIGRAESLNVAEAATVILYEMVRQRQEVRL
ncbi:MAG: TrmH family RNA methyltransferase [Candidatus Geothermincolia bacterium]